jgi:tellurite resistance protein TerC
MHSELIPLWGWILFYAMVLLMLAIDLKSFGRKGQHEVSISEALHMTVVWIVVSLLFCAGIYFFYPIDPHQKALEFLSGYLIEKSLSVDNLFVFLMLFTFFGVERKYQHEVLFWGIIGALVLRSIFIFLGAAVVTRFEWVLAIFGVFLLYSGAKMFTHDEEAQPDPSRNIFVRLFRRFFPVTDRMHGGKFWIKTLPPAPPYMEGSNMSLHHDTNTQGESVSTPLHIGRGRGKGLSFAFTPLFVALLVIETSDIAFAVDSIPAVFSVTQDPFIVLTSNIFAILGLRALYFALAAIAKYFAYLKYGLGIVLIFVGIKLLLHCHLPYVPHIEISTGLSLLIIFGTITISILASVVKTFRAP